MTKNGSMRSGNFWLRGKSMAKNKKSKDDKKSAKQPGVKAASSRGGKSGKSAAGATLKALADHPLVGEIVAAALVATASALKDPKRARALASDAGDEIGKLSKSGAERGSALWEMALQIGKRTLETVTGDADAKARPSKSKAKSDTKPAAKKTAKKKPAAKAKAR